MPRRAQPKILFVGGGFIDSQLTYVLPMLDGFCRQRGIERVMFEQRPSSSIVSHPRLQEILSRYEVEVKPLRKIRAVGQRFIRAVYMILALVPSIYVTLSIKVHGPMKRTTWFSYQIRHAVWDTARNSTQDGTLILPVRVMLQSAAQVFMKLYEAQSLLIRKNIVAGFFGHTVYSSRATVAAFRRMKVEVYAQAANCIYRVPSNYDNSSNYLTGLEWQTMKLRMNWRDVENHWHKLSQGKSRNSEVQLASQKKANVEADTPQNVVLLHVFRDSPFNLIDAERIFVDYVDWIEKTLAILSTVTENWLIRMHPTAELWGENQFQWMQSIIRKVYGPHGLPDHIVMSEAVHSNIEIFQHSKRILTYNGSAHIEAACWGIKPIIISKTGLHSISRELVLKPSSLEEYQSWILKPSNDPFFVLPEEARREAQRFIYARDHVLSFADDIQWVNVYRSSDDSERSHNLLAMLEKVGSFEQYMFSQGQELALGIPRTRGSKASAHSFKREGET